jgi:hypothetical protein
VATSEAYSWSRALTGFRRSAQSARYRASQQTDNDQHNNTSNDPGREYRKLKAGKKRLENKTIP